MNAALRIPVTVFALCCAGFLGCKTSSPKASEPSPQASAPVAKTTLSKDASLEEITALLQQVKAEGGDVDECFFRLYEGCCDKRNEWHDACHTDGCHNCVNGRFHECIKCLRDGPKTRNCPEEMFSGAFCSN